MFSAREIIKKLIFFGKTSLASFVLMLMLLFASTGTVYAQTQRLEGVGTSALGVARIVEVSAEDVQDGHIISNSENGAVLSNVAYDAQIQGVVAREAGIVLNDDSSENGVPVVSVGRVYVLVSTLEGEIKKGDQITTTSQIPGVGVKAVKSGYVIGTALEDYSNSNTNDSDLIAVDLNLHYFNSKPTFTGSLTDILKLALLPTRDGPTAFFKYSIAGLVAIGSFILGFMTFGRTAAKGVEALGRNPAASRIIHLGIIFNVAIVIFIGIAGLIVAFLILRL